MKISKERLLEILSEECGVAMNTSPGMVGGEIDQEGRMAKQQLFKAAKYSKEIHDMMRDDMQLESWVQAKITKAADYLSSVKHYLEYEIEQGQSVSAALAENKKS